MNKLFYKNEAATLKNLFENFKAIQPTSSSDDVQNPYDVSKSIKPEKSTLSKDALITAIVLFLIIIGMVAFLTVWLID